MAEKCAYCSTVPRTLIHDCSSVHKLPRVSTPVLHITNDLKNLYEKSNIAVKT